MSKPPGGLARYQSIKIVHAGEITRVTDTGCDVRQADGSILFRDYEPAMTSRYTPVPGDWWIIYEDDYQALSPRWSFEIGYRPHKA